MLLTFTNVYLQQTIYHNHGSVLYIAQWAQRSLSIPATDIQTKHSDSSTSLLDPNKKEG